MVGVVPNDVDMQSPSLPSRPQSGNHQSRPVLSATPLLHQLCIQKGATVSVCVSYFTCYHLEHRKRTTSQKAHTPRHTIY